MTDRQTNRVLLRVYERGGITVRRKAGRAKARRQKQTTPVVLLFIADRTRHDTGGFEFTVAAIFCLFIQIILTFCGVSCERKREREREEREKRGRRERKRR